MAADQETVTPNENDVVSGRGSGANRHKGNLYFRELIKKNKSYYLSLGKNLKMGVARAIHEDIAAKEPSGRFLQKNPETDMWFIVKKGRALEKISQALREKPSAKKSDHPGTSIPRGASVPIAMDPQMNNYALEETRGNQHGHRASQEQHHLHHQQQQQQFSQQPNGYAAMENEMPIQARMMDQQHQSRTRQGFPELRNQMYQGSSHIASVQMDPYDINQEQRSRLMAMQGHGQGQGQVLAFQQYPHQQSQFANAFVAPAPVYHMAPVGTTIVQPSRHGWIEAPMPAIPDIPQEFLRASHNNMDLGRSAIQSPGAELYTAVNNRQRHSSHDIPKQNFHNQHSIQLASIIPGTPLQRQSHAMSGHENTRKMPPLRNHSPEAFIVVDPRSRKRTNSTDVEVPRNKRHRSVSDSSRNEQDQNRKPTIIIDTSVDIAGPKEHSPIIISPQNEEDKTGRMEAKDNSHKQDADDSSEGTLQDGLAALSNAASMMAKQ